MKQSAEKLVNKLREKGLHIATAESCTGGMVSAAVTSVAGASEIFDGGVVSYANKVKHRILGVSEETLAEHGAVSEECAREMAEGVRRLMGADIGISLTGIAGPGGGTAEKPVGTVYLGVSDKNETYALRLSLSGDREAIRQESVKAALCEAYKRSEK